MAAAPTPLASITDLAEWLGEPIVAESETRAEWALRMASALVRAEAGQTWLTETGELTTTVPEVAVLVTLQAAGRAYTNPNGAEELGIDDYREQVSLDEVGLYLTASEKSLLARLATTYQGGLGTVTVQRGDLLPMCEEDERLLPPWY